MSTLEEAANQLGQNMITQNMAGLMLALTPEGMMKAMTLQGQLFAARQAAAAAGLQPPAPPTAAVVELRGQSGEDQIVHLRLEGPDGVAEVETRWRQLEGVWKVNDFALLGLRDKDGNPIDLSSLPGFSPFGSGPAAPSTGSA